MADAGVAAGADPSPPRKTATIEGKSVTVTHRDWTRLWFAIVCIPAMLLAITMDSDVVKLECQRPKPSGWATECQFVSYLNHDGTFSYANLLSKPNVTENFDLVDLLATFVRKPEDDTKRKKKTKGRFGSSKDEQEQKLLAAIPKTYGVELSLASGNHIFWDDYPTSETATYQSREIEDFIRESSNSNKPIKGSFAHEATYVDEILLIICIVFFMHFLSLTPFSEKLTFTAGIPSILDLRQWTLLGSTHHSIYDDLAIVSAVKSEGNCMYLKLKKMKVPLIYPSDDNKEKDLNAFIKECDELNRGRRRYKRKKSKDKMPKTQTKRKDASGRTADEAKKVEDTNGAEEMDMDIKPPPTSFMQDMWDNAVIYLVPLVLMAPVTAHTLGYRVIDIVRLKF
ncbi:hypothetical protein AAMO2058_001549300 [Amorphochlora amoebiformis]